MPDGLWPMPCSFFPHLYFLLSTCSPFALQSPIPFTKEFLDSRTKTRKKEYRVRKHVCIDCPLRQNCLGKSAQEKKFSVPFYREEYERNIARVESPQGRYMKGKRQSTVEPVFGTPTQFMGLRKVNTIGLSQTNKCMHLSAMDHNLKKYLKFIEKRSKSGAGILVGLFPLKERLSRAISALYDDLFLVHRTLI